MLPEPDEAFEQNLVIGASPATVFDYFFAPNALRAWWQAVRSVTTPVPFGVYAIEWSRRRIATMCWVHLEDVFHGTVVDIRKGSSSWSRRLLDSAGGPPLGPMALQVSVKPTGRVPVARAPGRLRAIAALGSVLRDDRAGLAGVAVALKRYAEETPPSDPSPYEAAVTRRAPPRLANRRVRNPSNRTAS